MSFNIILNGYDKLFLQAHSGFLNYGVPEHIFFVKATQLITIMVKVS